MIHLDDKYEVVTVDTGYKVYMKLHIKNIVSDDIAEYRYCGAVLLILAH